MKMQFDSNIDIYFILSLNLTSNKKLASNSIKYFLFLYLCLFFYIIIYIYVCFCACLCAAVCARGGGVFFAPLPQGKIRSVVEAAGGVSCRTKNYKKIKTKHKTIICQHKHKALEKKIKKCIMCI